MSFPQQQDEPVARTGYALCTEPRSGSNYVCWLLDTTGVLGHPTEYFNVQTMRFGLGMRDYPSDPESQLSAITRLGTTSNGVYGLKLFSWQFDLAKSTNWARRLPSLRFIHLVRLDVLGQAISHVRALQT